jgi:hypothetical protein
VLGDQAAGRVDATARIEADHQRDALALVEVICSGWRRRYDIGSEDKPSAAKRRGCSAKSAATVTAPSPPAGEGRKAIQQILMGEGDSS